MFRSANCRGARVGPETGTRAARGGGGTSTATDMDESAYIQVCHSSFLIASSPTLHRPPRTHSDLPPSASSRSRASHSARVISIFERAVRKFRYDLAVWHAYISWAKSRGMRVVVGRVYARALQLHPGSTQLWIDAAAHELGANSSPTAARALLQRGIRINKLPFAAPAQAPLSADGKAGQKRKAAPRRRKRGDKRAKLEGEGSASDEQNSSDDEHPAQEPTPSSTPSPSPSASSSRATIKLADKECDLLRLWVEYVRMELVFVERIRRRWAVLGIDPTAASQSGKNALEPQKDDASEEGRDQEESREENAVLEAVPVERADADADADADAESSGVQKAEVSAANEGQRAVLQGAIIRAVCEAALKGEGVLLDLCNVRISLTFLASISNQSSLRTRILSCCSPSPPCSAPSL